MITAMIAETSNIGTRQRGEFDSTWIRSNCKPSLGIISGLRQLRHRYVIRL